MNKEQKIKEIKELLKCDSISCVLRSCVECKSKAIFKNGYRKQGDVIKEVIEYLLNLSKGQGNVVFDIDLIDYALKKGVEL